MRSNAKRFSTGLKHHETHMKHTIKIVAINKKVSVWIGDYVKAVFVKG